MNDAVISVRGLKAEYRRHHAWELALNDVTFTIQRGEVVGIAGESGSGKSTLGSILLGERVGGRRVASGKVEFEGIDLSRGATRDIGKLFGGRIAFVPQNGGASLTPTLRIGGHFRETMHRHRPELSAAEVSAHSRKLLADVGLPNPEQSLRRFPHQFSGGQQQRITLALALCGDPEVLILDEPTTGQDALIRRGLVELLRNLVADGRKTVIFISHDLATLSEICTRIMVMRRGEVVEDRSSGELLKHPDHSYTRALIDAIPQINAAPRYYARADGGKRDDSRNDILSFQNVNHAYATAPRLTLNEVSFSVRQGETLALVGESGSGKSTLLRIAAGLLELRSGQVTFAGQPIDTGSKRRCLQSQRDIQIIFQNPDNSLNPRHKVGRILTRPLSLYFGMKAQEARREVIRLLESVQLPAAYVDRYPSELSGGEKQRVAIARALAAKPSMLLCDEIVSALDVSVQESILKLLHELKIEKELSLLFVTHDLAVARWFADRIVVLYRGSLVEIAPVPTLDGKVHHPYTTQLLDAVPRVGEVPGVHAGDEIVPDPDAAWIQVGADHRIRSSS